MSHFSLNTIDNNTFYNINFVKKSVRRILLAGLGFITYSSTCYAVVEDIPEESGFHGNVTLGAGTMNFSNNMVSGIGPIEVTDASINDLGSPEEHYSNIPIIGLELNYTFESGVQLFAGSALSDFLRLDLASRYGVRKAFDKLGIIGISYITATPVKVWADPYLVGTNRSDTKRTNDGLALRWERFLNTGFTIDVTYRNIAIDNESSGDSIASLTSEDRNMLNREGKQNSIELLYELKLGSKNLLEPAIIYSDNALDGSAMKHKRYEAQLSHYYVGEKYIFVTNLILGTTRYDQSNPIFGKENGSTIYGVGSNMLYQKPFGWNDWQALVGFAYYRGDADIDFYNTQAKLLNAGLIYNF
jgi:hypothetical protein